MPRQQQYPEDEQPPLLPSTNDFNNVLLGLTGGLQAGQNNRARRDAYAAQQQAAAQQQQFENTQKTDASNLAKANFWEKYAKDNAPKTDDSKYADGLNRRVAAGLTYLATNQDRLNGMSGALKAQIAKNLYEQSAGHINILGDDGLRAVYGDAVPVYDPETGRLADADSKDADPTQGMGAAQFARIMSGEDPSVVFAPQQAPAQAAPAAAQPTPDTAPQPPQLTQADVAPPPPSGPPMVPMAGGAPSPTPTTPVHLGTLLNPNSHPAPLTPQVLQNLVNGPHGPAQPVQASQGPVVPQTAPAPVSGPPAPTQGQGPITLQSLIPRPAPPTPTLGPSDAAPAPQAQGDGPDGQDTPDAPDTPKPPAFDPNSLFGFRDGYVSKNDQAIEAQNQKRQQMIAAQRQHDITFLSNLPRTLSAISTRSPMEQAQVIQQINAAEGLDIPVPWTHGADGKIVPPLPLDPLKLAQIKNQAEAVKNRNMALAQRKSEFKQNFAQRNRFHADLNAYHDASLGAKTGGVVGVGATSKSEQQALSNYQRAAGAYAHAISSYLGGPQAAAKDPAIIKMKALMDDTESVYNAVKGSNPPPKSQSDAADTTSKLMAFIQSAAAGSAGPKAAAHALGCADFACSAFKYLNLPYPSTSSAGTLEKQLPNYGWKQTKTPGPGDAVFMPGSGPSGVHAGVVIGNDLMANDTGLSHGPSIRTQSLPKNGRYYTYVGKPQGKLSNSVFKSNSSTPAGMAGKTVNLPGGGTITYPPPKKGGNTAGDLAAAAAEMARRKARRG